MANPVKEKIKNTFGNTILMNTFDELLEEFKDAVENLTHVKTLPNLTFATLISDHKVDLETAETTLHEFVETLVNVIHEFRAQAEPVCDECGRIVEDIMCSDCDHARNDGSGI